MNSDWKDSRTVQFAVGATAILIFAWWMFTGDIPFLSKVAFSPPPADGEVQAIEWMPVLQGMLVQACVIVGMSLIGLVGGFWGAVTRLFDSIRNPPAAASGQVQSQVVPAESPDGLARGLIRAVAINDSASKAKYEVQIRRPYATNELVTALEEGNFEAADERMRELKELAGVTKQAHRSNQKGQTGNEK